MAEFPIEFDENSLRVLKEVDKLHRNSLINVALALVSKTEYYKTLTGQGSEEVSEALSLSSLDDHIETKSQKSTETGEQKQTPKPAASWDNF